MLVSGYMFFLAEVFQMREGIFARIGRFLMYSYLVAWILFLVVLLIKNQQEDELFLFLFLSTLAPLIYGASVLVTALHGHAFTFACVNQEITFMQQDDGVVRLESNCAPFIESNHQIECFLYEVRDDLIRRIQRHPAVIWAYGDKYGIDIKLLSAYDQKDVQEDISALLRWHTGVGMPWRYIKIGETWQWPHRYEENKCASQSSGVDLLISCTKTFPNTEEMEMYIRHMWSGYFRINSHYITLQRFYLYDNADLEFSESEYVERISLLNDKMK